MATQKRVTRASTLDRKRVAAAVRKVRKQYARTARPAAWRKGGKEYARVLGHFGSAQA